MTHQTNGKQSHNPLQTVGLWACVATLVTACSSLPPSSPPQKTTTPALPMATPTMPPKSVSRAGTPLDYRHDVAMHLYERNAARIYIGKLPPLLYAVGVLQTDIDARGYVTGLHWMRAPTHAPEVIAEIERAVRQAAPYPVPVKLGKITSTETWLWHKSGQFQLHTLSEGQL